MNKEKFQEAMTEVGDKYIEEAQEYRASKKAPKMVTLRSVLAIAACICLVVGGLSGITRLFDGMGAKSAQDQVYNGYYAETTRAAAGYNAGEYAAKSDSAGGMAFAPNVADALDGEMSGNKFAPGSAMEETVAAATAAGGENVPETAADSYSKIIYSADISGETTDFDRAVETLKAQVEAAGGYFEQQSVSDRTGNTRSGYYTVRVPASQFQSFCESVGGYCHVTQYNTYAENVSESYYDLEVRLKTARTKMDRLLELLARADNMEDIIDLENAIADTETQIEYLTGSLRHYDALISFSTINVSLYEVYLYTEPETTPLTLGERIAAAFRAGLKGIRNGFENCVIWFARNWFILILWTAIITAGVIVVKKIIKKNRSL